MQIVPATTTVAVHNQLFTSEERAKSAHVGQAISCFAPRGYERIQIRERSTAFARFGEDRPHEGNVIRYASNVRQQLAHFNAAFAVTLERVG